ncbi:MAG: ABC transporter ATP-binding protein [Planctomycetota bacterium]
MPILTLRDLKKSWRAPDGEITNVIHVPEFSLDAGEQIAMRGESGTGKTTLLHLIAGILVPDSGEIIVDGQTVSALSEAGRDQLRAKRIGYIFQTFNLLHAYSALENVTLAMSFGGKVDTAYARELLVKVGLGERLHHRPPQLSVGQQQRVAVARALANRPSLVLADEPTGNLDHHRAGEAMTLIRELCSENNAALLLVTHDRTMLDRFERVVDLAAINVAAREAGAPSA